MVLMILVPSRRQVKRDVSLCGVAKPEGATDEIDLDKKNACRLRKALEPSQVGVVVGHELSLSTLAVPVGRHES